MGLFDSKSKVQTDYYTTTNTDQVDNSGNSGFLGIGGGVSLDNSLKYSSADDNSLQYASSDNNSRSYQASSSYQSSDNNSINDSGNSYQTLSDSGAVAGGFGLATSSLNGALSANSNALEVLKGLVSGALDNSVTLARDSISANKAATDQAIGGIGSLAQQSSQSTDDRVSKVALYAFAALAAVFVLPALFRGKAVSI